MSLDGYVNHIAQKYRLSIAIAVIRTKPNNLTIEKYIERLRKEINEENMDLDDLDISLCSEDFNLDNDDIDIIDDDNDGNDIVNDKNDKINDTQEINDSIAVLKNFDNLQTHVINKDNTENSTVSDILHILKEVDNKTDGKTATLGNLSQSTYCDSLQTHFLMASNTECSTDLDATFAESISNKELNGNISRIVNDDEIKNTVVVNDLSQLFNDSQEAEIYGVQGCTHYSASQANNITIESKYIFGVDRSKQNNELLESDVQKCITNDFEMNDKFNEIHKDDRFSQNAQNMDDYLQNCGNIFTTDDVTKNANDNVKPNDSNVITYNDDRKNDDQNNDFEEAENIEELTDSHMEIVPFKVIGELNKIKTFLNRNVDRKASNDGYSSDSGYRSDSQSKYSLKSLQSGTWLNQSAHCLFSYITQCPLVATTKEITNEISLVLGKLIDRLHEDEKYPPFLEELLETVDLLLRLIYKGESSSDNVLSKKDENIQRVFLLNKSLHIIKYTIEKITLILEALHTKISEDSLYEITYINEIENVCYLFYILEVILQKYNMKNQNLSSQTSTQPSQEEDKFPKKSTITDIWRKKWNPNYKENVSQENSEKKCVIKNCSVILNKIIVGCMDGYSLLAYAALKCFNLMQN